MQPELNPENTCAHLVNEEVAVLPSIEEMFEMQLKLQNFLAARGKSIDYVNASFKTRVDQLTIQKRNFDTEFVELLDRLPWKEWKTYTPEQLEDLTGDPLIETQMEFVDMFHFFMNIGLLLKIDGKTLQKLYYLKNKENFDRQIRGY